MSTTLSGDDTLPAEESEEGPGSALAETERPDDGAPASPGGAPEAAAHADGDVVDPDRYTERSVMSSGGMGRIVSARDRRLRRRVAIKELRDQSPEMQSRFRREALLTARLEHPSIVSIHEAGRWPTGERFYAMKLVPGRSLDAVMTEAETLEARLALLPHVLAIADALAYAHGQRVIHRDLKPQNVMVGEFGETVVIDWGLAKDLGDPGSDPTPDEDSPRTPLPTAPATAGGTIMGTPAYMPPEQAAGDPVDERADVYAIGAILYHLLSGGAPHTADNLEDVVRAVRRGPPPPLEERQAGLPTDLLAVVRRAMSHDRSERYPTARELAEDLRRFQSGQLVGAHRYSTRQLLSRWLRRHRTAVVVAIGAAVLLLALAAVSVGRILSERRRADEERRASVELRAQAEDLMEFMLFDLHKRLRPIGRLDLLEPVARKAKDYYADLPESEDPAQERRRAAAFTRIGDVLRARGALDAALDEYRASVAIHEKLTARNPARSDLKLDLARRRNKLGNALKEQGDLAAALEQYREALELAGAATGEGETEAASRRTVANSRDRIGDVRRTQGDLAEALVEYRTAMAIREDLAGEKPGSTTARHDLSASHMRVAEVLRAQGDLEAALGEYQAAMSIHRALSAEDPDNYERRQDLMFSHDKIGDLLRAQGSEEEALREYRAALAIAKGLAAHDPSHTEFRRALSVGYNKVGRVLLARGDPAAALKRYREALSIAKELAARDPTNTDRQRDLSVCQELVGNALLAQGDDEGALAAYLAALEVTEALTAQDPSNTSWLSDLGMGHYKIAEVLEAQGDQAGAVERLRRALAIIEELAARDPGNARWRGYKNGLREKISELSGAKER